MTDAYKAQFWAKWSATSEPIAIGGYMAYPKAAEAVAVPLKRKTIKHEEDALQAAVVKWFGLQYPEFEGHLWSCPNGGARNKVTGALMKRTGLRTGVADLQLAIVRPTAPALFIELKVGKNKLSDAQRDFLAKMAAQGYATAVAYDFNAARAAIVNHIGY